MTRGPLTPARALAIGLTLGALCWLLAAATGWLVGA